MTTQLEPIKREDAQVARMWIEGRPDTTLRAYLAEIDRFMVFINKPYSAATLEDVQAYVRSLEGKKPASIARAVAAINSLMAFAVRLGHMKYNPAAAVRIKRVNQDLSAKILDVAEVKAIVMGIDRHDVKVMVSLMYCAGLRVDEATHLTWVNVHERGDTAQITVCGKREKYRTIILNPRIWVLLQTLTRKSAYVFSTATGNAIDPSEVWRYIRKAAGKAGITAPVSAHWFRHAHASHALENGADVNLVRQTLGHASLATTSLYTHARPDKSSSQHVNLEGNNER